MLRSSRHEDMFVNPYQKHIAKSQLKKKGRLLSISRLRTFSSSLWKLPWDADWRMKAGCCPRCAKERCCPPGKYMSEYIHLVRKCCPGSAREVLAHAAKNQHSQKSLKGSAAVRSTSIYSLYIVYIAYIQLIYSLQTVQPHICKLYIAYIQFI